ncbi:hypothetical protein [Planotetraspora sp. GP83]|uniref:hypothetical protein n=1 Tax=Planotetraspora sp. GP83 TaxID=3156264 RepID=UPI0035158BD7
MDVLYAIGRDRSLESEPSGPGVIAESLIERAGGINNLYPLLAPNAQDLLVRLCERRGANYLNARLRKLLAVDPEEMSEDIRRQLARIEDLLRKSIGTPDETDQRSIKFSEVKKILGTDGAAKAWLEWAEQNGLVIRGAVAHCPHCRGQNWRLLQELSPPFLCRGCARSIEAPYGHDVLNFSYRASDLLLNNVSSDAIAHVLALRFLTELFRSSFAEVGPIFGGYPGVNFREPGSATVIGEADVLLVLADGGIAIGECKTRAAGLVEEELAKLAALADRLDASWTFVATLDPSSACDSNWRINPNGDKRPHFALTAEHLYDAQPVAILGGRNPLEWRDSFSNFTGQEKISPDEHKKIFAKNLVSQLNWQRSAALPWWRDSSV